MHAEIWYEMMRKNESKIVLLNFDEDDDENHIIIMAYAAPLKEGNNINKSRNNNPFIKSLTQKKKNGEAGELNKQ